MITEEVFQVMILASLIVTTLVIIAFLALNLSKIEAKRQEEEAHIKQLSEQKERAKKKKEKQRRNVIIRKRKAQEKERIKERTIFLTNEIKNQLPKMQVNKPKLLDNPVTKLAITEGERKKKLRGE